MRRFNIWLPQALGTDDISGVLPVTCGEPDLASMLPRECARKGLQVPSVLRHYCNVEKPYQATVGGKAGGMAAMLSGLKLTGRRATSTISASTMLATFRASWRVCRSWVRST